MNDERKFLHDIANPLGTAMFTLDSAIEDLSEKPEPNLESILQLQQVRTALEKVKVILRDRRQILIERG